MSTVPTPGELVERAFDALAEATEELIVLRHHAALLASAHTDARKALLQLRDVTGGEQP